MRTTAMRPDSRIFVAGHRGLVGSALVRRLQQDGFERILTATRDQLDLRDHVAVHDWFRTHRPEYVMLAAGTVGGILANATRPAEFIHDNLLIQASVVHAAHVNRVAKLLYLGCACMYPRECPQPIREECLLTGPLEPTSEAHAVAKIAGVILCQTYRAQYGHSFIAAVPASLYGIHDNFEPASAHVVPALIRRFHDARLRGERAVEAWGDGTARREFLHADDLADACLFLMRHYDDAMPINVGTGEDVSIRELAEAIRDVVYPEAALTFDPSKPNGAPRKLLDVSRVRALGWRHRIRLTDGIEQTYRWLLGRCIPEAAEPSR